MRFYSAVSSRASGAEAVAEVIDDVRRSASSPPGAADAATNPAAAGPKIDAAFVFLTADHRDDADAILEKLWLELDPQTIVGCSAEGVIGGDRPHAAAFQIAPSVRLMLCFDQFREHIEARPAGRHARQLVPEHPGRFREGLPAQWPPS